LVATPSRSAILGPLIVREIVYRVLVGEEGDVLRLLVSQPNRHGHIARVLRRIHADYADDLDVASLAREACSARARLQTESRSRHEASARSLTVRAL
jgi:transcriptional regulator GlxA family with amidase domain